MTDTPSDAAIEEALRLNPDVGYKPAGVRAAASCDRLARAILAHATTLQEVDRVAREVQEWAFSDSQRVWNAAKSLMLPDPVDSDEELAREVAGLDEVAFRAVLNAIKRLRADGRLTDAK